MRFQKIKIKNLLSFNSVGIDIELKNLNVFIGANGSGKSNFIEALSLFQSAPNYLASPVKDSGGISTWLYKNQEKEGLVADIEVMVKLDKTKNDIPIRHSLSFKEVGSKFDLQDEIIEDTELSNSNSKSQEPYYYYKFKNNHPMINIRGETRKLERIDVDPEQSILSQRKDPDQYPELTELGKLYEKIRIYREWTFGRYSMPRQAQKADARNDFLAENYHNLGLVLNKISENFQIKKKLIEKLKILYPRFEDYHTLVESGNVQIFFNEINNISIPATRLSDGTLRYLCLLAILYNPNNSSLICIEEPELGLHPDILPTIAQILKETSQEKQIVITTHSDSIISALDAEDIVVCENEDGYTNMQRLNKNDLKEWLEKYTLGELWTKGQIGGNRF